MFFVLLLFVIVFSSLPGFTLKAVRGFFPPPPFNPRSNEEIKEKNNRIKNIFSEVVFLHFSLDAQSVLYFETHNIRNTIELEPKS